MRPSGQGTRMSPRRPPAAPCATGAARPLYSGSLLDDKPARQRARRQVETKSLWRTIASPELWLHERAWSSVVESPAVQLQGGTSTDDGTPKPSRCRPAIKNSASLRRKVGAVGSAVSHADAGPQEALRIRAAARWPSTVVVSHASRKAAPSRSPTTRDTAFWTLGKTASTNSAGRSRALCSHSHASAIASKTRCHACSSNLRIAPEKGLHTSGPSFIAPCALEAPATSAASAIRDVASRSPKPPCRRASLSCCTARTESAPTAGTWNSAVAAAMMASSTRATLDCKRSHGTVRIRCAIRRDKEDRSRANCA